MKHYLLLLALTVLLGAVLRGQDLSAFQAALHMGDTLPYRILYPQDYDSALSYPLLMFLHGAGERGDDNQAQLTHGAELFLDSALRRQFTAFVVFPQCPKGDSWNSLKSERGQGPRQRVGSYDERPTPPLRLAMDLLAQLKADLSVDPDRVYLGGLSMGGMGTFEWLARDPAPFAAAFAICGGGYPDRDEASAQVPLWIFHGDADGVVPVQWSRDMYQALQEAEAIEVKYTEYPGVNHNSWDRAFDEPTLLPWLFSHRRP